MIFIKDFIDRKSSKTEKEFMDVFSKYKDHGIILRIDQKEYGLDDITPDLFELVCNFAKYTYDKIHSKSIPDIPA